MSKLLVHRRIAAAASQGFLCIYCRLPMCEGDPDGFARRYGLSLRQALLLRCTAEHLRARQDGGGDGKANVAAACAHCNMLRHRARDPLSPLAFAAHVQHRLKRGAWLPAGMLGKLGGRGGAVRRS